MQQINGLDLNTRGTAGAGAGAGTPPPPQTPQQAQTQLQLQQWAPHMQQQWMGGGEIQYPAAAMVMMMQQQQQQQMMMMYPQQQHHHHYMAAAAASAAYYQQQQQQHQQQQQQQYHTLQQVQFTQQHNGNGNNNKQRQNQGSGEEFKTIWVGDLLHWMDETYLHSCFSQTGSVSSVKVIRNKQTGQSEGYGFVEFYSHEMADKVLQNYNGTAMPNTDQAFHLNWASFAAERRSETGSDLSIFVGDLAADVTDTILQETFSCKFPSVRGAKVVIDSNTGRSKGYGFVRFGDENERSRAIMEMNGVYCSTRPMRVGVATPKKSSSYQQRYSSQAVVLAGGHASNGATIQGSQSDGDPNNTTIFVGGIDSDVSDEDLRQPFSQFGEVVSVKIPTGKGCGFVQFANRKNAEDALENLNGTVIGKQTVRLSWGRSPANKHWRGDHNNQWNGANYGGQGYGGYGYAVPTSQDPNMYSASTASGAS